MESLIAPSINLLLLVLFLFFKLKQPIRDFVFQRHASIRDEVQAVRDQLRQAQNQYEEFSAKLKATDAEIAILREQAQQDSAAMKQKILMEARRLGGTVISDAKNAAEGLYSEFRGQLYLGLSSRVLAETEKNLRHHLTADDRAKIQQEFSLQMESIQ